MLPLVYLVDDDSTFNKLTARVIKKHLDGNVEIISFNDPEEAVDDLIATDRFPDFIFLDIRMPSLDGWEVLSILNEEIENLSAKTEVIMLTTSILPTDKLLADKEPAVTHYINKPLDIVNATFVFNKLKSLVD